jgi:hypothetical protein
LSEGASLGEEIIEVWENYSPANTMAYKNSESGQVNSSTYVTFSTP